MWFLIVGCFFLSACTGESLHSELVDNVRIKRQHQQQQQQPQHIPDPQINYQPYNQAPQRIKQLLELQQARETLVHLPAQPVPQLHTGSRAEAPQQERLVQPTQYSPKVQYGQAPQQPTYKGIQGGGHLPGPAPAAAPQGGYTPQFKSQYAAQAQQPGPNALYRAGPPQAAAAAPQYHAQQSESQYPKNLPPHIQKIIDSQRAYQGSDMSRILKFAYSKGRSDVAY